MGPPGRMDGTELDPWCLDLLHLALGLGVFGFGGWCAWYGLPAAGYALMILGSVVFAIFVAVLPEDPEHGDHGGA